MAVNINTVYQKVLAFANKEQRGYITPQEFNLYANQAQIEIYEQYHYDVNNFEMRDASYSLNNDTTTLVRQKLDIFISIDPAATVNGYTTSGGGKVLPAKVYRLSRVSVGGYHAEYMDTNRFMDTVTSGPLVRPTVSRPIHTTHDGILKVNNGAGVTVGIEIDYYRLPNPVSWGYFVIGGTALYDSSPAKTTHFELHSAEESELVYRILTFAGISMQKPQLVQSGITLESAKQQQEKQ
tara:strand:- start:1304 stop:2017 length:714 start_codon:yes stop_codon:yes gene_type:complete